MADVKISALTDGGDALATDDIVVNRSGVNRRVRPSLPFGPYATLAALIAAKPPSVALAGRTGFYGSATPYTVVCCDGASWVDGGWNATPIAFSTSIPFRQAQRDMGIKYVTGALAFSVDATGAARGSSCQITVVADGTNVPSFAGIVASSSDSGYVNTSGVVNTLWMWYDGLKYYYQWSQDAALFPVSAPDITAPTFASLAIANSSPSVINITMSEPLAGALPATSAFSVAVAGSARGVLSVTSVDSTHFNLTLALAIAAGDAVTLAYSKPGTNNLKDAAGNETAAIASTTVANSVSGSNVVLRMTKSLALTESGDGNAGYNYVSDGTGSGYSGQGVSSAGLPAATDGSVQFVNGSAAIGSGYLGFKAVSTTSAFANFAFGVRADPVTNNRYRVAIGGTDSAATGADAATVPQAGDNVRLRRAGSSATPSIVVEVSRVASPNTWLTIHTYTSGSSIAAQLYAAINMSISNLNAMSNFRATGFV